MPVRFDSVALREALDRRRQGRGLSWAQLSKEIGVAASTMTRLKVGGRLEVDGMLTMVDWLGVPVETFIRRIPA